MLLLLFIFSFFAKAETWPELNQIKSAKNNNIAGAVIIAVEDYVDLPDIAGAKQNGDDWYFYFTNVLKLEPKNVRYMVNSDVRKYRVQEEIKTLSEQLKSTEESRQIWVIFIGHGSPSTDNTVRFLTRTAQANVQSIEEEDGLTQDDLLSPFTQNNLDVVAFFDACFSGLDTSGNTLVADLQPFALTRPNVLPKQTIFTATGPGEYAGSLPSLGRPAFSYLALGGLQGWADNNKDGKITASELEQYTQDTFKSFVLGRTQTPQLTTKNREQILGVGQETAPNLSNIVQNSDSSILQQNDIEWLSNEMVQKQRAQFRTSSNKKDVEDILIKKCNNNNFVACYELGMFFKSQVTNDNVTQNEILGKNTKYYLEKGCHSGVAQSCNELMTLYILIMNNKDEMNGPLSSREMHSFFKNFCSYERSISSLYFTSDMFSSDGEANARQNALFSKEKQCVDTIKSLALQYFLPANVEFCLDGEFKSCQRLNQIQVEADDQYRNAAVQGFTKLCKEGNMNACYELSVMYKREDWNGTNSRKAWWYSKKACFGGVSQACEK